MWEAFNNVLEKGGVVAALFFVVLISFGFAVRALWNSNEKQRKDFAEQIQALKSSCDQSLNKISEENQKAVGLLAEELGKQLAAVVSKNEELHDKVDSIQERRVTETKDNTERMMSYIRHTDAFVLKLEAAIDVLLKASRNGNGR